MGMKVWFVTFSEKMDDGEWQDVDGRQPHKIFIERERAVDCIFKRVGIACDRRSGNVIRNEVCHADGYFMVEWKETIHNETKHYMMQIPGYTYEVE